MEFEQIRSILETSSLAERKEFLETYNFQNNIYTNYKAYYREYIIANLVHKDLWFVIALIELAEDLQLFDTTIASISWKLYKEKHAAIYLKITILDYFAKYPFENKAEIENLLLQKQKEANNELIKTQLATNLLILYPEKTIYQQNLYEIAAKTTDYRCLIRLLNNIEQYAALNKTGFNETILSKIKENDLSKSRSVAVKIGEMLV